MYCVVTREPIDAGGLLQRVRSDADGAVLVFAGVVRDHHEGRAVEALAYEAYEAMAVEKLEAICEDVGARYEVGELAVAHRVGDLAVLSGARQEVLVEQALVVVQQVPGVFDQRAGGVSGLQLLHQLLDFRCIEQHFGRRAAGSSAGQAGVGQLTVDDSGTPGRAVG